MRDGSRQCRGYDPDENVPADPRDGIGRGAEPSFGGRVFFLLGGSFQCGEKAVRLRLRRRWSLAYRASSFSGDASHRLGIGISARQDEIQGDVGVFHGRERSKDDVSVNSRPFCDLPNQDKGAGAAPFFEDFDHGIEDGQVAVEPGRRDGHRTPAFAHNGWQAPLWRVSAILLAASAPSRARWSRKQYGKNLCKAA